MKKGILLLIFITLIMVGGFILFNVYFYYNQKIYSKNGVNDSNKLNVENC